jgi:topoisomerase-4 subunit A
MSILDDVISTIRSSETRSEAKGKLIADFDFSDPQSEYILMMRLQTLV